MNDPLTGGSHGKLHWTTKILSRARRRSGGVAARGARAVPERWVRFVMQEHRWRRLRFVKGRKAMKREKGNWVSFRERLGLSKDDEIDRHFGQRDRNEVSYHEAMAKLGRLVEEHLRRQQEKGRPWAMFIHGHSTSRPGQTTARSVVRGFMRSKEATPFIVKAHSIQHCTVFIAKIRSPAPTR